MQREHTAAAKVPEPIAGMRLVDTAFPHRPWIVAQYVGPGHAIYICREDDGHLFHHDVSSWAFAWRKGYLTYA